MRGFSHGNGAFHIAILKKEVCGRMTTEEKCADVIEEPNECTPIGIKLSPPMQFDAIAKEWKIVNSEKLDLESTYTWKAGQELDAVACNMHRHAIELCACHDRDSEKLKEEKTKEEKTKEEAEAEAVFKNKFCHVKWLARIMDDDVIHPSVKQEIKKCVYVYFITTLLEEKDPSCKHEKCIGITALPEYVRVLVRAALLKTMISVIYLIQRRGYSMLLNYNSWCEKRVHLTPCKIPNKESMYGEHLLSHEKSTSMTLFKAILGEDIVHEIIEEFMTLVLNKEMSNEESAKRLSEYKDKYPGTWNGIYTGAGIIGKIKRKFGDAFTSNEINITCTCAGIIKVSAIDTALVKFLECWKTSIRYRGQELSGRWLDEICARSKCLFIDNKTGVPSIRSWIGIIYATLIPESCDEQGH
jgi:hypothetical protein